MNDIGKQEAGRLRNSRTKSSPVAVEEEQVRENVDEEEPVAVEEEQVTGNVDAKEEEALHQEQTEEKVDEEPVTTSNGSQFRCSTRFGSGEAWDSARQAQSVADALVRDLVIRDPVAKSSI